MAVQRGASAVVRSVQCVCGLSFVMQSRDCLSTVPGTIWQTISSLLQRKRTICRAVKALAQQF